MLPSHHRWNLIEICLQMEHPDYQRRYPDISLPEKGSDGFNALYNPSGIVWCLNTIHHTIPEGVHPRAGPGRIGVKGPARGRTRQGMYQSSIDRGPGPSTAVPAARVWRSWSLRPEPPRPSSARTSLPHAVLSRWCPDAVLMVFDGVPPHRGLRGGGGSPPPKSLWWALPPGRTWWGEGWGVSPTKVSVAILAQSSFVRDPRLNLHFFPEPSYLHLLVRNTSLKTLHYITEDAALHHCRYAEET